MRLLVVAAFTAAVYIFTLVANKGNGKKAAKYAALAAAVSFLGSQIMVLVDGTGNEPPTARSADPASGQNDDETDMPSGKEASGEYTQLEDSPSAEPVRSDSFLYVDEISPIIWNVDGITYNATANTDTQIDVCQGSLTFEGQVDAYSFTPSIAGRYRLEIADLTEGTDHRVKMVLLNAEGGEVASSNYGFGNGDGLTVDDVQSGETYQIQVAQWSGLDSYTLHIGCQKEMLDVTGYTVVEDSVGFKDQRNIYQFIPPLTGTYRFEISDLTNGADNKVLLTVLNAGGGEETSRSYGFGNGDGLTVYNMRAGEPYQIHVRQNSGYDTYHLNIGYQKEPLDVSAYTIIADSIQYRDQNNIYLFTPTVTGRYRFEISNLTKGSDNKVNLSVWNARGGEEASTSYGIGNGEGLTIYDMQAGETYQIHVRQASGYDAYCLEIGKQKKEQDISGYQTVSDSIQYTDQRNVYFFKPSLSGSYRFEIQGMTKGSKNKVNILIFNSRDGEEGSTRHGIGNGEGLTIYDMQAEETYQVQVRHSSGYDAYELSAVKIEE